MYIYLSARCGSLGRRRCTVQLVLVAEVAQGRTGPPVEQSTTESNVHGARATCSAKSSAYAQHLAVGDQSSRRAVSSAKSLGRTGRASQIQVVAGGKSSAKKEIFSGVPQGAKWSPKLWNFDIADMPLVLGAEAVPVDP